MKTSASSSENAKNESFRKVQKRLRESAGIKSGAPTLELFQKEGCPASHVVRSKLTELGLDFIAHTVPDHMDLKHKQLIEAGGKDQIPYLIDRRTGVKLYNSDTIVSYLENEYELEDTSGIRRFGKRVNSRIRARADQISWAARQPVERIYRLRRDAGDVIETFRGSLRMIRQILEDTLSGASSTVSSETPSSEAASPFESPDLAETIARGAASAKGGEPKATRRRKHAAPVVPTVSEAEEAELKSANGA